MELPAPIAITNLLARYAELIDAGDFDGIGQLFAHATVTAEGGGKATGAAEVAAMYVVSTRRHADGTPRSKHVITNPIIELDDPDTGRCRSYFTVFMSTEKVPLQAIAAGRYRDEFRRIDGVWSYSRRHIILEFLGDVSEHLKIDVRGR
jgi:3-phenylpropionate/cinnamic acid dioxygenase small subunit